jgi:hypothetical protein
VELALGALTLLAACYAVFRVVRDAAENEVQTPE